ncbi:hypothetical protein OUZ56_028467 [Daphnia magna]|uniref:Uncharacterized protein n=1 Tax=Daphnia magna TaxID=35525 RepID=A0ABR0B3X8_9CRUS|nr:hypothetical protein OUZ56_028467 [Daphnia magna]
MADIETIDTRNRDVNCLYCEFPLMGIRVVEPVSKPDIIDGSLRTTNSNKMYPPWPLPGIHCGGHFDDAHYLLNKKVYFPTWMENAANTLNANLKLWLSKTVRFRRQRDRNIVREQLKFVLVIGCSVTALLSIADVVWGSSTVELANVRSCQFDEIVKKKLDTNYRQMDVVEETGGLIREPIITICELSDYAQGLDEKDKRHTEGPRGQIPQVGIQPWQLSIRSLSITLTRVIDIEPWLVHDMGGIVCRCA